MKAYSWFRAWGCTIIATSLTLLLTACGGGGGFAREDGGTFGTAINPPPGKVLVQGAVFDEDTGAPLINVEVSDSAPATEIQRKSVPTGRTRTDADGKFVLDAQPDQNRDIQLFFKAEKQTTTASFSLEDVPEDVETISLAVDLGKGGERATPRDIQVSLRGKSNEIPTVRQRQHLDIVNGQSSAQRDGSDFGNDPTPIGGSVDDVDLIQ